MPARSTCPRLAPALLTLFVLVMLGRIVLVGLYASPLPFADMWDAEGGFVLKRWVEGTLSVGDLFQPHNEHRIVLTRLVSLGLFAANANQWDNLVNSYANTLIYALVALGLYRVLSEIAAAQWARWVLLIGVLVVAWIPWGSGHSLIGFQNQYNVLGGLALATIWLAVVWRGNIGSLALLLAVALCGLFTMASGLLGAVVAGGLIGLRYLDKSLSRRQALLGISLLSVVALLGKTLVQEVPDHAPLHAPNIWGWLRAFGVVTGWPLRSGYVGAVLLWLPTALVLRAAYVGSRARGRASTRKRHLDNATLLVIGLASWTLLQAAAVAYSRGKIMHALPARYMDTFSFGLLLNLACALRGLVEARPSARERTDEVPAGRLRSWERLTLAAFLSAAAIGLRVELRQDPPNARRNIEHENEQAARIQRFLEQGDAASLNASVPDIPYPNGTRLAFLLSDPTLRAMLPARIRLPLDVTQGEGTFRREAGGAYTLNSCGTTTCNAGTARWVSGPMSTSFSAVVVPVVARGPKAGLGLGIEPAQAPSEPDWNALSSPRSGMLVFAAPSGPFRLLATDSSDEGWLGVGGPREIGPLSRLALELQEQTRHALLRGHSLALTFETNLPIAETKPTPRRLSNGESLLVTLPAPRDGVAFRAGVEIGTFAGKADGTLTGELCAASVCTRGEVDISTAKDHAKAWFRLPEPLALHSAEPLTLKLSLLGSTHPISIATFPDVPGSAHLRLPGSAEPAASVALGFFD